MRGATAARMRRRAAAVMTVAMACVVLPSVPLAAAVRYETSVTMYSDGEWVGGGAQRFYYPGNGSVSVSGSRAGIWVGVSGGAPPASFGMEFTPPSGKLLDTGLYTGAERSSFREAGRPGIDISGDGRGCNTITGRFDIKELVTRDGKIQRLWLTYEQHCEGGIDALFGEVRYRMPTTSTGIRMGAQGIWWPNAEVRAPVTVAPVTVMGGGTAATVKSATITGLHKGDFSKRVDDCTGVRLRSGDLCQIWIRVTPTAPGPRVATLVVEDSTGARRRVSLDIFVEGGRTRLYMESDDGDYIGGGGTYTYTPRNASIGVGGNRQYVSGGLDGSDGSWWYFTFAAPDGDILAPGVTYKASRYPFNGTGAGMDVSGEGRGCNQLSGTFTVKHAAYWQDGTLKSFKVNFEQHCEHATPALRGTLEYRLPVGDVTPPGAVSGVTLSRDGSSAEVRWTNPSSDYAATIVRYVQGGGVAALANSARSAQAGAARSATIKGLRAGRPLVVWIYAIDAAGNVSRVRTIRG